MSFLARGMERKTVSVDQLWEMIYHAGFLSKAGPAVTIESAFKVAAFFACIRVIAQGVAQVPFKLHRETLPVGAQMPTILPARDHYLYDITSCMPNDATTSFEFRESLTMHAALGNGYAWKNMVGGKVHELILLNPARVEKVQNENDFSVFYRVRGKSGDTKDIPAKEMWHVRGPSWDGLLGVDLIKIAREALGLSLAAEASHASLHANGVRPSGVYSVEGTLSPEQNEKLKKWIEKENAGANSGGILVLDRAAKFMSTAMTGMDAQHIELRTLEAMEVCRFCGVLPIMVGIADKTATYASSEQMFLAHVVHTLMPWYARIEQSADANLLSKKERTAEGLYFKFIAAGLLRGDLKSTAEYIYRLVSIGAMTRNEARAKMEMNPLDGLDAPLTPVNMTTDPMGAPDPSATPPP